MFPDKEMLELIDSSVHTDKSPACRRSWVGPTGIATGKLDPTEAVSIWVEYEMLEISREELLSSRQLEL